MWQKGEESTSERTERPDLTTLSVNPARPHSFMDKDDDDDGWDLSNVRGSKEAFFSSTSANKGGRGAPSREATNGGDLLDVFGAGDEDDDLLLLDGEAGKPPRRKTWRTHITHCLISHWRPQVSAFFLFFFLDSCSCCWMCAC